MLNNYVASEMQQTFQLINLLVICYFTAASQLMSQKLKTTYKASTSKVMGDF